MRRTVLLVLLTLVLTMALAVVPARPAAAASGCPPYIACMDFIHGGCSCSGFYCDGRFICGVPLE